MATSLANVKTSALTMRKCMPLNYTDPREPSPKLCPATSHICGFFAKSFHAPLSRNGSAIGAGTLVGCPHSTCFASLMHSYRTDGNAKRDHPKYSTESMAAKRSGNLI